MCVCVFTVHPIIYACPIRFDTLATKNCMRIRGYRVCNRVYDLCVCCDTVRACVHGSIFDRCCVCVCAV